MMADDGLKILKPFDAIYFGAVGFPTVPDHISLRGLRLADLPGVRAICLLSSDELLPGVKTPLANKKWVTLISSSFVKTPKASMPVRAAVCTAACRSRSRSKRLCSHASVSSVWCGTRKTCAGRRKKLVSATKSNAQQHSMTFWDEVVKEVGKEFPDVTVERELIDALSARFHFTSGIA